MTTEPRATGSWRLRRRVVNGTLLFIAAEIVYFTVWGTDTALHQQIAVALIALAGAVIGSYVFGAVWDDKNARKDGG